MDHGSITYYGRQEFLDNGGVQLNFQSGFEVIFTGTSAARRNRDCRKRQRIYVQH